MKMSIPCSMCGVNPALEKHRCGNLSIYENKECDCCDECKDACWKEYVEMIDSGEADQEVIDFFMKGPKIKENNNNGNIR